LSSKDKPDGVTSRAPVHVANPPDALRDERIWITEGAIKANVAASRLSAVVVGVPGVAQWHGGLVTADSLGAAKTGLVVAFDGDAATNPQVRASEESLALEALRRGWAVEVARWGTAFKGVDDALVGGTEITLETPDLHKLLENETTIVAEVDGLALANAYVERRCKDGSGKLLLRRWRGDFYLFGPRGYARQDEETFETGVCKFLERVETWKRDRQGQRYTEPIRLRSDLVREVVRFLPSRGDVLLTEAEPPLWLDGRKEPDPAGLVVAPNSILDPGTGAVLPPTPDLFTTSAIATRYDPDAPEPSVWLDFLATQWADDPESTETLQEFMGLCLTADTSFQKMLFLIGPRRSGKGTVARTLRALLGTHLIAGPTLDSLAENFGLQSLLGKLVGIVPDARLSGRRNTGSIIERLLAISGEDTLSVPRKHQPDWIGKLSARLILMGNELPHLVDASAALAGRFIVLRMPNSFFGREDRALPKRLEEEAPGILLWALDGLRRLRQRGHLRQPGSGAQDVETLVELASPITAFVSECCELGPAYRESVEQLYHAWTTWCADNGREPGSVQRFGGNLRAACPSISKVRPSMGNPTRKGFYDGIRLLEQTNVDLAGGARRTFF
jgi:putative DNA primase/helicase